MEEKEEKVVVKLLKDNIIEFYTLKQKVGKLETQTSKLNLTIKEEMKLKGLTEFKEDGYTASYNVQKRNSLNNEKLVLKLTQLGLENAIKTIQIPNEEVIENLIYNGELDPVILQDCTEVKNVEVLKITFKKSKGEK